MAIEGVGTVISLDASVIGEVTTVGYPDDNGKEWESTGLSDTREQWNLSAMREGQLCPITIRLNPEAPAIAKTDSGAWVITLPKQTAGSAAGATYSFTGYVLSISGGVADYSSTEGITRDVVIRLTSESVEVVEA
tara:strand:- start:631 stop:1035 length:405 start_codon:yes stop_codon:yes gene_type:complete